jgi:DNA polymerase
MYETLEELNEEVKKCTKCDLCKNRTNTVLGSGNPKARVMFIGEGPRSR